MQLPHPPLTAPQMRARKLSLLALLLMVVGSLGVDQVTKIAAQNDLMVWENPNNLREYQGRRYPVFALGKLEPPSQEPAFYLAFNLNYVRNQGAAWGALSDWDDRYRIPFFYMVTLMAVIVIGLYLKATPLSHRLARFALALILSGAIGNFLDRVQHGYVIDFLDFRWVLPLPFPIDWSVHAFSGFLEFLNFDLQLDAWRYNFPNFNWADSAITVGVAFLIYDMLVLEHLRKRRLPTPNSVAPPAS